MRRGQAGKKNLGGRPPKPESVVVRIGKREYDLTFALVAMPRSAPFRDVYVELVRRAGAEA